MTLMRAADGGGDVRGRRHHFVQHAVDAIAHLEFILERLEVNVGCLVLDGLQQHEVDQLADGIAVGGVFDGFQVDRFAAIFQILQRVVFGQFAEDVADAFGGGVVMLLDQPLDLIGIADLGGDVVAHQLAKIVQRAEVFLAGHDDGELFARRIEIDRQNFVGGGDLRGNGVDGDRRNVHAVEVDQLITFLSGQARC